MLDDLHMRKKYYLWLETSFIEQREPLTVRKPIPFTCKYYLHAKWHDEYCSKNEQIAIYFKKTSENLVHVKAGVFKWTESTSSASYQFIKNANSECMW